MARRERWTRPGIDAPQGQGSFPKSAPTSPGMHRRVPAGPSTLIAHHSPVVSRKRITDIPQWSFLSEESDSEGGDRTYMLRRFLLDPSQGQNLDRSKSVSPNPVAMYYGYSDPYRSSASREPQVQRGSDAESYILDSSSGSMKIRRSPCPSPGSRRRRVEDDLHFEQDWYRHEGGDYQRTRHYRRDDMGAERHRQHGGTEYYQEGQRYQKGGRDQEDLQRSEYQGRKEPRGLGRKDPLAHQLSTSAYSSLEEFSSDPDASPMEQSSGYSPTREHSSGESTIPWHPQHQRQPVAPHGNFLVSPPRTPVRPRTPILAILEEGEGGMESNGSQWGPVARAIPSPAPHLGPSSFLASSQDNAIRTKVRDKVSLEMPTKPSGLTVQPVPRPCPSPIMFREEEKEYGDLKLIRNVRSVSRSPTPGRRRPDSSRQAGHIDDPSDLSTPSSLSPRASPKGKREGALPSINVLGSSPEQKGGEMEPYPSAFHEPTPSTDQVSLEVARNRRRLRRSQSRSPMPMETDTTTRGQPVAGSGSTVSIFIPVPGSIPGPGSSGFQPIQPSPSDLSPIPPIPTSHAPEGVRVVRPQPAGGRTVPMEVSQSQGFHISHDSQPSQQEAFSVSHDSQVDQPEAFPESHEHRVQQLKVFIKLCSLRMCFLAKFVGL